MATGLTIYRELVEPSAHLVNWLDARAQLYEIQDKAGNTHLLIENDLPRPPEISEEIVGRPAYKDAKGRIADPSPGCTKGFALFSEDEKGDWEAIGFYRSLERAERAKANTRVVVSASIEGAEPDEDWNSLGGKDDGDPEASPAE